MHSIGAKWVSHRIGNVVCIVDLGGAINVAGYIRRILDGLRNGGELVGVRHCLCRDSDGMWDEMLLSDSQEFLGFATARTNSLEVALSLVGVRIGSRLSD